MKMTDSYKSIADLSEEEKTYRLNLFDRFMKASEEKLKENKRYQFSLGSGVLQWRDFKDTYKEDIKENFLLFRHSGGEWEQYELESDNPRSSAVDYAWRYVEGEYNPNQLEELIREELEEKYAFDSKPNYEPGSSIPESKPYKIKRELAKYDDNKKLTPKSEIKKPSFKKFKIPKSVLKYAAEATGGKPKDTAKLTIQGAMTELKKPLNIDLN